MAYAKRIVSNPWPAGMLAIVFSAIPLFGWVGLVLIGLMTLCRGPRLGFWVAVCAAVPAIIAGIYDKPDVMLANAVGACFYTWLSAVVLWYARSWTLVLEATLVFALVGILTVHLLVPDIPIWWVGKYQELLSQFQARLAQVDELNSGDLTQVIDMLSQPVLLDKLARMTTGVTFSLILLFNLVNLFLARWWQIVAFDGNSSLSTELTAIRMGYVALAVFFLTIAGAWFDFALTWDMLPILVTLFLCAGLSLLHFYAAGVKNGALGLVIFYALMITLPAYMISITLILAVLDTIFNLRQRRVARSS